MDYLLYIHLVISRDLNIELLPISTDNIWKLCGLELKDILIQQEFNFIGKGSNYYTGKEKDIYSKGLNCEHSGQLLTLYNIVVKK